MRQSIQEFTKSNLWNIALAKIEVIWSVETVHKFAKGCIPEFFFGPFPQYFFSNTPMECIVKWKYSADAM